MQFAERKPETRVGYALAVVVLVLATTHCVMSIFYVNTSWINLHDYAHGHEKLPFQGRLLMSPIVRWGENSAVLQRFAARFSASVPQPEPMSGAKLLCLIVGIVCTNALGIALAFFSKRLRLRPWWIGWAVLIAILYASYAARFEQPLWYPYDLPHMFVFGVASIAILLGEPVLFLCSFVLDVTVRETAVFLLPFALALHYRSVLWRWISAFGALAWVLSRVAVHLLYPHNAVIRNGPRDSIRYLLPWHLPQLFSIVGFLWIPVLLGRRHLSQQHRLALYTITAMMLATFYYGVWNETRVWLEWSTAFAIFGALELQAILAGPNAGEAAAPSTNSEAQVAATH